MAGFEEVPRRTGARSGGQLKVTKFSPHAFHLEEKIADSAAKESPDSPPSRAGELVSNSFEFILEKRNSCLKNSDASVDEFSRVR